MIKAMGQLIKKSKTTYWLKPSVTHLIPLVWWFSNLQTLKIRVFKEAKLKIASWAVITYPSMMKRTYFNNIWICKNRTQDLIEAVSM